jgi:hypothetical protein
VCLDGSDYGTGNPENGGAYGCNSSIDCNKRIVATSPMTYSGGTCPQTSTYVCDIIR